MERVTSWHSDGTRRQSICGHSRDEQAEPKPKHRDLAILIYFWQSSPPRTGRPIKIEMRATTLALTLHPSEASSLLRPHCRSSARNSASPPINSMLFSFLAALGLARSLLAIVAIDAEGRGHAAARAAAGVPYAYRPARRRTHPSAFESGALSAVSDRRSEARRRDTSPMLAERSEISGPFQRC